MKAQGVSIIEITIRIASNMSKGGKLLDYIDLEDAGAFIKDLRSIGNLVSASATESERVWQITFGYWPGKRVPSVKRLIAQCSKIYNDHATKIQQEYKDK